MTEINFNKIEKKWQDRWAEEGIFEVKEDIKKKKYYVLEMFPYPSGEGLHMGHALNYVIGDVFARFKKMNGFNVLHPMGYDALGLPAENAAIKDGVHPEEYTFRAIKNYSRQLKELGIGYDWRRVVNTADPHYYKWDQWIFLKMLKKNLAYQKEASVNWCPKCDTVLANEQVVDGKCWRHDDINVKIKKLRQWFFRITKYSQELLDGIEDLKEWPERTRLMQKNWIGKSQGTQIDFEIEGEKWPIFTTRPDTIFGVTFMVVSAEHPKLHSLVKDKQKKDVDKFLKNFWSVSEKATGDLEKEGVFTGSYAINPANDEKIPIYVGNFVVADYGSGMVMAVPAHDQRDFEFAKKYGIEIKQVIGGGEKKTRAYTGEGKLINSPKFNGLDNISAKEKITSWLSKRKIGKKVVNFKLRDWGISRQRYWGTPIPIIYCEGCGVVPVPEKDLPVLLPHNVKFGKGNPLETAEDWINVSCPECGGDGKRETDTMDTFVNSSWYFLRYADPLNSKEIFDKKKVKYWSPIDFYVGGAEHACMHLIYFRFYTKFLRDIKLLNFDEPAKKMFHQGMLLGEGGIKMSKSKGNVINPEVVSEKYGIDTARFFLLSLASPDKDRDWSEKGIAGSLRFVKRLFSLFDSIKIGKSSSEIEILLNETIVGVTKDIESVEYRAAAIKIKSLFDRLIDEDNLSKDTLEKSLKLLSPFCPHITEELWEKLGNKKLISAESWPEADKSKVKKKVQKISDLNSKIVDDIKYVLDKTGKSPKKIYLYVMPFEIESIDVKKIEKEVKFSVEVFSVDNPSKYDPKQKFKKARPGKAAIYFE